MISKDFTFVCVARASRGFVERYARPSRLDLTAGSSSSPASSLEA
jgi:hypothetical protein